MDSLQKQKILEALKRKKGGVLPMLKLRRVKTEGGGKKRKRTIENVTRDVLFKDGQITLVGWAFLQEIASFIQSRFYPKTKEPYEMKERMIVKGAEQILGYDALKKEKPDFDVRDWRNYIFTGMRNTASNYQYHLSKDVVSYEDVDATTFLNKQEYILDLARSQERIGYFDGSLETAIQKLEETCEEILDEGFFVDARISAKNSLVMMFTGDADEFEQEESMSELEKNIARKLIVLTCWKK